MTSTTIVIENGVIDLDAITFKRDENQESYRFNSEEFKKLNNVFLAGTLIVKDVSNINEFASKVDTSLLTSLSIIGKEITKQVFEILANSPYLNRLIAYKIVNDGKIIPFQDVVSFVPSATDIRLTFTRFDFTSVIRLMQAKRDSRVSTLFIGEGYGELQHWGFFVMHHMTEKFQLKFGSRSYNSVTEFMYREVQPHAGPEDQFIMPGMF